VRDLVEHEALTRLRLADRGNLEVVEPAPSLDRAQPSGLAAVL
jgi:hypothetical protein